MLLCAFLLPLDFWSAPELKVKRCGTRTAGLVLEISTRGEDAKIGRRLCNGGGLLYKCIILREY